MPDRSSRGAYVPVSQPVSAISLTNTDTSSHDELPTIPPELHHGQGYNEDLDYDQISSLVSDQDGRRSDQGGTTPYHDETEQAHQKEANSTVEEQDPLPQRHGAEVRSADMKYTTTLHRNVYVLFLTLLYAGLASFSWVVTCILVFRPITASQYSEPVSEGDSYDDPSWGQEIAIYAQNTDWFRAARVVQSVVSVLTIPLTSAVCASAAVVFAQNHQSSFISMRQVMTLADNGWTDPLMYLRLFLTSNGFKRYGSSFLLIAMALIVLGGAISPLQEAFLYTSTIQTPTRPSQISHLADIPDRIAAVDPNIPDTNLVTILTRNALLSASTVEPQPLLWQGSNASYGLNTFGNISALMDPFLAQLPEGYSTGLITQFIPRINSTAHHETTPESEFPTDCANQAGAFFVEYSNSTIYYPTSPNVTTFWGLQACMPNDMTKSPWKSTRARQDFSEELYLNITLRNTYIDEITDGNFLFKVTINTTAGYFELPNIMNNQTGGQLLDDDPNGHCGSDCVSEGLSGISFHPDISPPENPSNARREITANESSTLPLEGVWNKGPALTVALALFGEDSYIDSRFKHPGAYLYTGSYTQDYLGSCINFTPLGHLIADPSGNNESEYCIRTDHYRDLNSDIMRWLTSLGAGNPERLTNAFTASAFLANQAWLINDPTTQGTLSISYDHGAPSQKPDISQPAMVAISVLLGLDLMALLAMALYACLCPRWTNRLDSFAMMRLGAAYADKVPLLVGKKTDKIKVLDELPGSIGDETELSFGKGRLAVGAGGKIVRGRSYECYEGDHKRPLLGDASK